MTDNRQLQTELLAMLKGGNAHMTFAEAVADFPAQVINGRPPHIDYTFWHLLEHMRLAQRDILNFIREPGYVSPPYPEGYWPAREAMASEKKWQKSIAEFEEDLNAMAELITAPGTNLLAPLPHAPKYTLLREALLVADHNAYHVSELITLRQVMAIAPSGAW